MFSIHRIYIGLLTLIIVLVTGFLIYRGYAYYSTGLEERFFQPGHQELKPSGLYGHGLGIIGSTCMLFGVFLYLARKRFRSWSRLGLLKYWLEFHIFLCTLGPILVLFHTSFKFGGLVAISFWSMVAVFISGVAGRFIYIQIPRSIEGKELSLNEIRDMKTDVSKVLNESYSLDEESFNTIVATTRKQAGVYEGGVVRRYLRKAAGNRSMISDVKHTLKRNGIRGKNYRKLLALIRHDIALNRKIDRLVTMQNLFRYWHVAHLPFAFVMLIIMLIHVGVSLAFGYHWIF